MRKTNNKKHIKHSGTTAQCKCTHIHNKQQEQYSTENERNTAGHRLGTVSGKNTTGEFLTGYSFIKPHSYPHYVPKKQDNIDKCYPRHLKL